jgi:hypothetical protein
MAIFYYNGLGAQGLGDGSSAANASVSSSSAISALGTGNSVEVTAGTFTLSAAEANGKSISGAGNVAVTAISSTLNANLSGIAVSGTKTGAFDSSGIFTGDLGTLDITVASGAVLSATALILYRNSTVFPRFTGDLAIASSSTNAGFLLNIDNRTNGSIDASALTSISGHLPNLVLIYNSGFTGLGNEALTLNDSAVAADLLNTLDGKTSGAINAASNVTSIQGAASDLAIALSSSSITTLDGVAVTVSAGTAAATDLNTIDANTTAVVDATAVTTISGPVANVLTAIGSSGITTATNYSATLTDTSVSVSHANEVDLDTTGVVTATISEGGLTTLSSLTGTGNAYTITLSDTTAAASTLNALFGKTTVAVNAASVTTLTGTAVDVNTAYSSAAAGTITGLGNEAVTLSGSTSVAEANSVDGSTDGVITATITEGDLTTLGGLTGTGNAYTITVSDASVNAADLNTLDGKTTINVNAASVGTLTGTAAAIDTAINASTIDTGAAVLVNVNSGSATVAQANSIHAQTSGVVTATISDTAISSLGGLSGTGNAYTITVGDASVDAADLNALDGKTTVTVNAASVGTLTGTAADVNAAYTAGTAGTITGLGNEAVMLSDTSLAATVLNTVNGNTTGVVHAGSVTTLTGLLADVNKAYAANTANTINGLGDEAVTITNSAGTLLATDLSTAGAATSGTVTVTNGQTVTGTVAEVTAALVTASSKVVMGSASTATVSNAATSAQGEPIATTANITASFTSGISDTLANLASSGTISSNLSSITADQGNVVVTISDIAGGTLQAADLSAVGSATTGAVSVTNSQTVNGTADQVIAAVVTSASKVDLIPASTLNASTYTNQDLSGVSSSFTLNVTTVTGADLDATKLATADSITLVGTNTATAADADTLGQRLGGTATVNITTDPITANTDLSDLGSSLTLQFGGDSTVAVNGATLTVRQDQVSGYTISGSGTVAASGTAGADTFNASGITATTNFTSLAESDSVTIAPSALGSVDVIDGGADTDTLIFSTAASGVVDVAFTNVSSVEILQLAAGTNSVSLGAEAQQAGITTVTGGTDTDTLNLLYGTTGLSFNAGTGVDTLSYSADSTAQAITLSSIIFNTASGSVVNNGTDNFTGLEVIVGGSGTTDSITSISTAEVLIVTGANAGTIDGFGFSGVESVYLSGGNDTATVQTSGSLSGSLNFDGGIDTLLYTGYGTAVSATLNGADSLSSLTAISGGVTGVENLTLSTNNDTLTVGSSGSLSGSVDFGAGSGDSLSYAGIANAITLTLNSATSTGTGGATGILGTVTGFDNLVGGSGSDYLNATSGVNSLNVASNGTITLDSSLTVSGFETINLAANSDASSDTATFSAAFSGSVDLGAGNDAATINTGGSVTNLAGGSGSDSLSFDVADNTVTISGSGNGTDGTTSFTSFEAIILGGGNDTTTINSAATTTITLDGGAGSDNLQVASTDTANNSLTLSGVGGGVLGNVTFLNQEAVSLGSGNDTVLLANGSSLAGNLNLGGGSNTLQIGQVSTGLTSDQATFWTTTDNYSEIYLNGAQVGTTSAWESPFSFNFTGKLLSGNNVIAVASHDSGGIAGMQAQLVGAGNTVLLGSSNPGWKFSLTSPSGWQDASFDDSSWSSPIAKSQTSDPWGNKMPVNDGSAGWIWSPDPNGDNNVYFRYSFNYIPPGTVQDGAVSLGSLSGGAGADTVSLINGTVSGDYNAGDGANTLTISGTASSLGSYQGGSGGDTINLTGGDINGAVSTGAGDDRLVLADPGSSVTGAVDFGSGSGDTLSYAGNSAAATVSLSGANSIGAAGATGIGGSVSGFEVLVGGNGSDSLTAQAGSNSFTVSSGGVVNLDTSLTVSGFETINLGGLVDTANLQGGFSGSLDLGAGNDSVTLDSGGSATSIAGGSDSDTLTFNASANSVSFGASGSGSGQSTNFSGFETVNLLAGDDSASFSGVFAGSVDLGDGNDTATINTGGSTTNLAGGAGTDTLNTNSSANSLTLSGADGGSVDGTAFTSFETLNLASGNDTVTVAAGGSLTGNLNLGDDSNSLTLQDGSGSLGSVTGGTGSDTVVLQGGSITGSLNAGEGSNSLTISGSNASVGAYQGGSDNDAITLSGGTIFGNVALGNGDNSLLISSTNSSIGGSVSFGSGSADALSYAGYGTALNLTLNTATSLAAGQAPGVMGAVSGFETLTGTSGSDSLNAATGSNTLVVAIGGGTSLDGLNFNSFESINLGANGDASADSVTLSGNFSGSIDLGAGNDTTTINGGGANFLDGGTGSDTLNFNGSANSVRIDASGGGSTGSTGFSGFETINTLAGEDTITLGSAATTTQIVDGGDDTDLLQVASSDSSNNTLTLSSAGGGALGGVSFANIENIALGSGSDSVTLASGGGLASRQPGLLADFYNKSGAGVAGSLLRSGVVLGPVNVQDQTLQSLVGKSDQVYLFAQGFLTVPGSGSYNDFILSTTSDDGVRVKIDLAGTGAFSNVINNYTDHGPTVDNSSPQSVTAGQRIPIQIEWFESGGGAILELYYQSSSQGIGRTLVPISNLSSSASSSLSGSLDLGAGDDTITFQSGSIGVASLTGGAGTDLLNFASYGSGVSVDLASGTSTGTSGISGFEQVIGSSGNDTLVASTSDANLLVGNAGDDSFGFTINGLTSADTVQGGTGRDTLVFSTAGTVDESQFSNVSSVEQVVLNGASSFSLGTSSQTVGVDKVFTGSGTTEVSTTIDGYDLEVEANSLANNTSLSLSGSSASNDFVVTNLKGDLVASGTSGSLSVTTGDNTADNTISITIGSGATTITGGAGGDTLSIDAALALENSNLTLAGSSNEVVTNLVGDISATYLSGSLTVTTGDADDDGISITTGIANTTINASGDDDTITVNADAMADNTTLTLSGSAGQSVSNLQANTNASGTSGTVTLNYKDVADNAAGITTGSGATSVSGSGSTDTLTVNASSLGENTTLTQSGTANQTVTNLVGDISATNLSGSLTVTTGDAGDNSISITTGSNNTAITANGSGDSITVNADAMADNTSLSLSGSATETVTNLQANTNASATSGEVSLSYKDVADNVATITTGSGATTVGGSSSTDTLSVNASALAQAKSLIQSGNANQVVTGLVADISATNLSGSLTVTTADAVDNGISITTGSGNTTINASGAGDTVTVNADGMFDNKTLDINGSASYALTNLEGDLDGLGSSGSLTISYSNVADNAATLKAGSGNVVVTGGDATDTITVTGLSTNNQIFTSQASTSNFSLTAGAGSQTITGSNSGNDSIDGGAGSDTLSFAGGSNVVLSITDYSTGSGGVTGQGTDQFSRIETLLGATGTDELRGIQSSSTNEVLTITGSNSGTMADAAGSGSFAFSSFEQTDLAAGDDVLRITGSGSLSGRADGGAGTDLLDYSAYTASGVEVDLASGKATAIDGNAAAGLVANSFENVTGSSGDDKIVGDSGANLLLGGAGNDSLDGGAGSDTLNGGSGDDLIEGGSGNDLIIASWGNDTIRGSGGATGSLTPSGEVDRVSYAELGVGFDVSLSDIDGASLKLDNNASLTVAQIIASYNPLTETISAPSNQLSTDYTQTLSGIQQIVLGDFNDVVRIDANGYLTGASQAAGPSLTLDGGAGLLDTLDYSSFGADSPVYVNLSSSLYRFDVNSNREIEAEMGDITLVNGNAASHVNATSDSSGEGGANGISGFEVVIGGGGNDAIVGSDAANILVGNGGNNRLAGGAGDDTIFGGSANDFIIPGSGNDLVLPGAGMNTISVTSSDLTNDQFILDITALNFFQLEGDGAVNFSDNNISKNTFDPGSMGIHILTGGNPVDKAGVTTYDSIEGTSIDDTFNFTSTVLKNIQSISMGTGDDVIFTAPTAKGVTVLYDGGGNTVVGDSLTLNLTFADFRKLNQSGRYTFDLQPYLDDPNSKTLTSTSLDMAASGWERASVSAIAPAVYNSLPGDPAAFTYNTVLGLSDSTIRSGESLNLSGRAVASSGAEASSANDVSSALVQANQVMGAQAVTLDAGTDLSGSSTASHQASASAVTGNNRSDAVLSAYGVGADLSDFSAGRNLSLNLSGSTDGLAKANSIGYIANAAGTVDVVGSSDSSVSAGQNLTLSALGVASQDVQASNVQGVSLATLASRSAGISDPNVAVSGDSADGLTAGQALTLTARAAATNSVRSQGTTVDQIATLNLVDAGPAADDFLQSALVGVQFPLINGDRIRFSTAGGGVLADRDYWVFNRNAFTGTFQISDQPGGEPVAISANAALGAYRPADALADALAGSTAVQLSRSGVGNEALQAGSGLGVSAEASQVLTIAANSVDGAAAAGLNRIGGFEGMDAAVRSLVVAQKGTSASAAGPASLDLSASLLAGLEARSVADRADSEANAAVVASDSSSTSAGQGLTIKATASNNLSSTATSTDGSAQARSGAGAGAGVNLAVAGLPPDAISAQAGSYGASSGLVNASQQAGGALAITASASSEQRAVASTVGGSRSLPPASSSSDGYLLVPNNQLADGDPIRISADGGSGLSTSTAYRAGTLGFTVDPTTDTITSSTGIAYSPGDPIRFRLNSSTALNDGNNPTGRSGLSFGTTYYVLGAGTSFQVSASVGGPPVPLTADSIGSADTLLDADRIRVLEPLGSGQAYGQATITNNISPITLVQPSAAVALAGGRDGDTMLSFANSSNSATVTGLDGQADQNGSLRSLSAGEQATISALASGVVTAVATNTAGEALAIGSQVADGLKDLAITSGSDGTITASSKLTGNAEAASVGLPSQSTAALANLTVSARGLTASDAANDISIGGVGDVDATASLAGRSTASTVLGDSDALAALKATGLEALSNGFTATIGQQGDISATATIGSLAAPLIISALSSAEGDATAQAAAAGIGILGSYDPTAPAGFSSLQAGTSQGDISGTANADLQLSAIATNGAASVTLADVPATGRASITGIENMALTAGAGLSGVDATAAGRASLFSQSVVSDASSQGNTAATGLFSSSGAALPVTFANDGRIAAIAQQSSFAQSVSVNGNASSTLNNTSLGIGNATITISGDGSLDARAISQLDSRSQSVAGAASA